MSSWVVAGLTRVRGEPLPVPSHVTAAPDQSLSMGPGLVTQTGDGPCGLGPAPVGHGGREDPYIRAGGKASQLEKHPVDCVLVTSEDAAKVTDFAVAR